jgi:hypothetical protein
MLLTKDVTLAATALNSGKPTQERAIRVEPLPNTLPVPLGTRQTNDLAANCFASQSVPDGSSSLSVFSGCQNWVSAP